MKVDLHSSIMSAFASIIFRNAFNAFANELSLLDKNIRKVQLYSDYYLPNGKYPFIDSDKVYYPLTLIYKNDVWKILWVCWSTDAYPQEYIKLVSGGIARISKEDFFNICNDNNFEKDAFMPFVTKAPFSPSKPINIVNCDDVPKEFNDMILGKKLFFKKCSGYASPQKNESIESYGKESTSFVDALSNQLSARLVELSGKKLSGEWNISLQDRYDSIPAGTVSIDGVNYRLVGLATQNAEVINIGVCWKENYDVCDYVNNDDISFSITEIDFGYGPHPLDKIIEFIQNGGFLCNEKQVRKNYSYPDVTIEFYCKKKTNNDLQQRILNTVGKYVLQWNNNEKNEDKIHDFFLIDSDSDKVISVFVDFGNCNPNVLAELLNYLDKGHLKEISKISVL